MRRIFRHGERSVSDEAARTFSRKPGGCRRTVARIRPAVTLAAERRHMTRARPAAPTGEVERYWIEQRTSSGRLVAPSLALRAEQVLATVL